MAITSPTRAQLDELVAPYLQRMPQGLGFAIGYASPHFPAPDFGGLYFAGNVKDQQGNPLALDGSTTFAIASVSKTLTATLVNFASIRSAGNNWLYEFPSAHDPWINRQFHDIQTATLLNYT
jgi:hypothetical protein